MSTREEHGTANLCEYITSPQIASNRMPPIRSLHQFKRAVYSKSNNYAVAMIARSDDEPSQNCLRFWDELAQRVDGAEFLWVDAVQVPDVVLEFEITGWPTFLFFSNGQEDMEMRIVGAHKSRLQAGLMSVTGSHAMLGPSAVAEVHPLRQTPTVSSPKTRG